MRQLAYALVAGFLISPLAVRAEEPAPDSHAQAAMDLLMIMDVEKEMTAGAETMTDLMIQQNAMLAPYKDVILKWASSFLTWKTFGPRVVALYKENFTESELRDMAVFYKTPTGQKALTAMPALMQKMMELGSSVAKEHTQELEPMIRARSAEIQKMTAHP